MLPKNRRKVFFKYSEDDIVKAIDEISAGAKVRETCRKYGIPHSTIINKIKLRHPVQRRMGPPTILTPNEETLLKTWILAMAKKGFPVNKEMVIDTVKHIMESDARPNPFKDNKPGKKWFSSFLNRHQEISVRHAESINMARSLVTEAAIRKWHADLKQYLVSEGAQDILEDPERIINSDESGFQCSPSSGLVLGPVGFNHLYDIKDKEKENITVLGTFAASGRVFPPAIVYQYERIPAEIVRLVNDNWCVGKSEKGWMTSKVFYGFIANTFVPYLKQENVKFPVLLVIDGHKSHINQEVSKLCSDSGIILYALYPNATHIIQPADVSVFGPMKSSWKKVVSEWRLKTGHRHVTKALFAPLMESTFNELTKDTIRNGFRKCGLYPFDADAICYQKCITNKSRHELVDKPAVIGPEHLLYFESLMSGSRARQFRACNGAWTGDESAKELFYVWTKINKQVNEGAPQQELAENSQQEVVLDNQRLCNESGSSHKENPSDEHCSTRSDSPTILESAAGEKLCASQTELKLAPRHEKTPEKRFLQRESPCSSKQASAPISPAFSKVLVWPSESPIKSNKKNRTKVRLPDAVNSIEWTKYWNEKEAIKKEKEEKKAIRAAKRSQKEKLSVKSKKNNRSLEESEDEKDAPIPKKKRSLKIYSDSEEEPLSNIKSDRPTVSVGLDKRPDKGNYVIVKYEGEYFPGTIENVDGDMYEISTMSFSSGNTFRWPERSDKIWYQKNDIVEIIAVPTLANVRGFYRVPEMDKFMPKV